MLLDVTYRVTVRVPWWTANVCSYSNTSSWQLTFKSISERITTEHSGCRKTYGKLTNMVLLMNVPKTMKPKVTLILIMIQVLFHFKTPITVSCIIQQRQFSQAQA